MKKSICGGAANTNEADRLFRLFARISIEHLFCFVNTKIEHPFGTLFHTWKLIYPFTNKTVFCIPLGSI